VIRPASPGHAARLVMMSSYLYYWCDSPCISDDNFDRLCRYVSRNFDRLGALRQYQMGSADDTAASGHHVRISVAAEHGARAWHEKLLCFPVRKEPLPEKSWRWNKRFKLHLASLL
jgi:hypothetical protein